MRILIVTSRFPYPPWRGNQVRTTEWLDALSDHEIAVLCPAARAGIDEPSASRHGVRFQRYSAGPIRRATALAAAAVTGRPIQEGLYATRPGRRAVGRTLEDWRPHLLVVQMVRCGWAAEAAWRLTGGPPVLFDAIDAMGLHFDRAADAAPRGTRTIYRHEATRCRLREAMLAQRAQLTVAVSLRDLKAIGASRSMVVPVAAREPSVTRSGEPTRTVLLSGNLGYRPTVDGALWFAREVWPHVRAEVPGARWTLAGARPSASVRRLGELEGVDLRADVPDLTPYMATAAVAIAPMASGSGVPMKVLEAWAAGVPVVGHPWMAGGLEEEARTAMVVAQSAEQWREALVSLLLDRVEAERWGARGREAWRGWYHPERIAGLIRQAVQRAVTNANSPGPGPLSEDVT